MLPVAEDGRHDGPATVPPSTQRALSRETERRLLTVFRQAAAQAPAYRTLLREHGVAAEEIGSLDAFTRLCPILSKENTFERFPIDQLGPPRAVSDIAEVLTSSGRGGRFSFGLSTRDQASAAVEFLDDAFDQAFEVKRRPTLAINCLPMGVGFSSRVMTLATTSVREDMVVGLVQAFGSYYDQLLLVTDPLFLKRLTDHAAQVGLDWHRYRVNVCIAEEIFGEHFRTHVSGCLGTDVWRPDRGRILSSFGVGELGLYLGYETQTTIALRRAAHANPELARDLFAAQTSVGQPLPMLFAFDPQRTFLEIVDPDTMGYGRMTISMLEPDRSVPLLRYQAGDIAALLDAERVAELAVRHGLELPGPVPAQLFALRGRVAEALPNGAHVGVYKDALYATPRVATSVTGAVRVIADGERCTMHVQLGPSVHPTRDLEAQLRDCLPQPSRRDHIVLWPYARFPFGMTLDYERKFAYYVPGELPSTIPD